MNLMKLKNTEIFQLEFIDSKVKMIEKICKTFWEKILDIQPELAIYRGFKTTADSCEMYDKSKFQALQVILLK